MIQGIKWGTFVFFAAWSVISGIYTYFLIPETK